MIDKVTNTQCRSKILFFVCTFYNSLKHFLSETSNAIFSLLLFSTLIGEEAGNELLGCALSTRWTPPSFVFLWQDAAFFSFIFFYSERSQRLILLAGSTFKSEGARFHLGTRFKMSPIFGHVSVFWMSSSRKFACRLFWLKQELRTEGEQVRYCKIHVGLVAFRPKARSHSRPHPFHYK